MNCIFGCSSTVTAVSPLRSAPQTNQTTQKVAQVHQMILNSIPGSLNTERVSSPLLDQPVILLSPPKATLGFRPIPSEFNIVHTELPPNASTQTTPDDELKTPDDEIEHCFRGNESPWTEPCSECSSESRHDTPDPTPRSTPPKGIEWDPEGSTPSDEELTPADYPEEICRDEETPGELFLSPPLKKIGRSLCDSQPNPQQPENLQPPSQTTLSFLISLNSQRR